MTSDTGTCPSCQQPIPTDRLMLHLAGLDGARPECPRQDLIAIASRAREDERRERERQRYRAAW